MSRHNIIRARGATPVVPFEIGYAVAEDDEVYKTINGGTTWNVLGASPNGVHKSVYFVTTEIGFVGSEGGGNNLHRTLNGGTSFNSINISPSNITDISAATLQIFACCSSGGGIYRTINQGASWVLEHGDGSLAFEGVHLLNTFGYAVANRGTTGVLLYSTNSGDSWIEKTTPVTTVLDLFVLNTTTLIICGNDGQIYRSTNSGDSWTNVSFGGAPELNHIHFPDGNALNGYIGRSNGTVIITTDGGLTWAAGVGAVGAAIDISGVAVISSQVAYVCEDDSRKNENGVIYKTTNGGVTWNFQALNSENSFFDIYFPRR